MSLVSAVIPAHNEGRTVGDVVRAVKSNVGEVIVVDCCSDDQTALEARQAGARVIRLEELGKHRALRAGILAASGEELIIVDADIVSPEPRIASFLLQALRSRPGVSIAKASYGRPYENDPSGGGRLTELCAKPLLAIFLPQYAHLRQPLAGEFAVRRRDLADALFAPGFAVDLGILIHCAAKGDVVEVDLGTKTHKHRPLRELREAAIQVAITIIRATRREHPDATLDRYIARLQTCPGVDLNELPPIGMLANCE